jgi:hypothetical protein
MTEEEKNALYEERARVVVALARTARALGRDVWFGVDPAEPAWPVLYIDLPTGQASWHLTQKQRTSLAIDIETRSTRHDGNETRSTWWDGHTTKEKYDRLDDWRPSLAPISKVSQINRILRDWWNPIGFDEDLPDDEYLSYAEYLYERMTRSEETLSVQFVANYLTQARTKTIGLAADDEADLKVAQSIVRAARSW